MIQSKEKASNFLPTNTLLLKMAPIQEHREPTATDILDWHITQPTQGDLAQDDLLLRNFGHLCLITDFGSKLQTIEKKYGNQGEYSGLIYSTIHLPEQFNGMWCRFFYREQDALIFVMDYDTQDFAIYDLVSSHCFGRWMLAEPLPSGAFLTQIESNSDDANQFNIIYALYGQVYSLAWSFSAPQFAFQSNVQQVVVH